MFWLPKISVQFVDQDGCYVQQGIRVRAAPGHGQGSLSDEMTKGIMTPLDSEETREALCKGNPEKSAFIRSLPSARIVPCST